MQNIQNYPIMSNKYIRFIAHGKNISIFIIRYSKVSNHLILYVLYNNVKNCQSGLHPHFL
jgi:hypothetical protein